jgi:type IV pilus assembly protein PilA
MKRFGKRQKGFTLIELLVVVGIMAALAAIIVPNVARFVGSGKAEGAAAEGDALQAGIDAAMADQGWLTVNVGTDVTDFSSTGYTPGDWTYDPDGVGGIGVGDALYLYPDFLRIQTAKYGSDGLGGATQTGWDIGTSGEVALP